MARRTGLFLKESVVLFGFLNGLWLAIGVNPGAELFEVLVGIVEAFASGTLVAFLVTAVPIALLGGMLYLIWRRGGWLGFVAVGLAFVSGMMLLGTPRASFFLLVAAMALGYLATR